MKVRELYKYYRDYDIKLFGRPLKEKTLPFSLLPNKNILDCEVVEMKIQDTIYTGFEYDFKTGKTKKYVNDTGIIYAYVR